jgi:hypothetical protein
MINRFDEYPTAELTLDLYRFRWRNIPRVGQNGPDNHRSDVDYVLGDISELLGNQ